MSGMEVSDIRNPGDLIFSLDNEIMTVAVLAGQNIQPGDPVSFNLGNNFARKGTDANVDVSEGFGVCIHEGFNDTGGTVNGRGVIQIATGNAYVAVTAGAIIKPFKNVKVSSASKFVTSAITIVAAAFADQAASRAAVAALSNYVRDTVGRCYGNPGEMVKPGNVAADGVAIVRLGRD